MKTIKILSLALVTSLCASVFAQFPYTGPDAWHTVNIDGKPYQIAEYDGMAIVEGDIILGTIDDVLNGDHRSLFRRNLWTDGIVGYSINPAMPAGNVDHINSAIAHIEALTSIVFEERATGDYILFAPTSSTCSSSVGRQGGSQLVGLAPACNRGNTVHEIMHALGFHHEHQRPDRDQFVTIDLTQTCFGSGSNFAIINAFNSDQMGPYDYTSIMHYFFNTFSCTGQPTIIGPPGQPMGSFFNMSANDARSIEYLYFVGAYSSDDDEDDVENVDDRCLGISDSVQLDTDDDGFGNLCDPDLNNDGIVNVVDLGILRSRFFTSDPDADLSGDGVVNVVDLGIMRSYFFAEPGPSGRTPGKVQILGTPGFIDEGAGTVAIDLMWSVASGLPHEYVVELDVGGGFAEACRTSDTVCVIPGVPDDMGTIDLRVHALSPYGNAGADSLVVSVEL